MKLKLFLSALVISTSTLVASDIEKSSRPSTPTTTTATVFRTVGDSADENLVKKTSTPTTKTKLETLKAELKSAGTRTVNSAKSFSNFTVKNAKAAGNSTVKGAKFVWSNMTASRAKTAGYTLATAAAAQAATMLLTDSASSAKATLQDADFSTVQNILFGDQTVSELMGNHKKTRIDTCR